MPHALYIFFVFAFGACVGSFLNVVVWRLPRGESLVTPPSHCPNCNKLLKWYDNVPILGWIKLGGKCRYCREPISMRYPIVEAVTAIIFVLYYVLMYVLKIGPGAPVQAMMFEDARPAGQYLPPEWPIFALYLVLLSGLLAASLIDAELFLIPLGIPWTLAAAGVVVHAVFDRPTMAGAVSAVTPTGAPSPVAALATGGTAGLALSLLLWWRGKLPIAFPAGEPLLEVERETVKEEIEEARRNNEPVPELPPEYTPGQIRWEMRKEMLFLLFPLGGAILWYVLTSRIPSLHASWELAVRLPWVSGLLGSLFGGLVGGFVVWITRILGTLGFGRVAMGLGDVDLMFGVGAIIGAGPATLAFFVAPFFGIALALYKLFAGTKRELPYGPYLSLASAFVLLFYSRIYETWLRDGLTGLGYLFGGDAGM